jgi:hypothetical protein
MATTAGAPPQIGFTSWLFEPGVTLAFEQGNAGKRQSYKDKFLNNLSSSKAKETFRNYPGMGPAVQTQHGAPLAVDTIVDGYATVAPAIYFTKLLGVDKPTMDDDKYYSLFGKMGTLLNRADYLTDEILAASLLNNGFSTVQSDGVVLFSNAHPLTKSGGTASNLLTTAGDPSFATFSAMNTQLLVQKDGANQPITYEGMQKTYVYHPDFADVMRQVFQSRSSPIIFGGPGNANTTTANSGVAQPWNDSSFLLIKEAVQWYFITRQAASIKTWTENNPEMYLASLVKRIAVMAADWRGGVGTPGI